MVLPDAARPVSGAHAHGNWGRVTMPHKPCCCMLSSKHPRPACHSRPAAEGERADWALYAENVRRLMGKRLGQPLVEQASGACCSLFRGGLLLHGACIVCLVAQQPCMAAVGGRRRNRAWTNRLALVLESRRRRLHRST